MNNWQSGYAKAVGEMDSKGHWSAGILSFCSKGCGKLIYAAVGGDSLRVSAEAFT
jgi:hypothetical protein